MKTLLLAATVLITAITACNEKKSKVTIIGSWIMPVEGQPGKMQGIRLGEDGEASSINMATLVYKYYVMLKKNQLSPKQLLQYLGLVTNPKALLFPSCSNSQQHSKNNA